MCHAVAASRQHQLMVITSSPSVLPRATLQHCLVPYGSSTVSIQIHAAHPLATVHPFQAQPSHNIPAAQGSSITHEPQPLTKLGRAGNAELHCAAPSGGLAPAAGALLKFAAAAVVAAGSFAKSAACRGASLFILLLLLQLPDASAEQRQLVLVLLALLPLLILHGPAGKRIDSSHPFLI